MKLIRRKGKSDLPGSIFRPKYRDKDGNLVELMVYWVKYYKDGKPLRESTKTTDYEQAVTFLADRMADVTKGKTPNIKLNRVRFNDLSEDFLSDYRINGKKSLERAEISVAHLKDFFGNMLVIELDTSKVRKYIEHRMGVREVDGKTVKGASNATINRELAALKRMLNLGAKSSPPKVDRVPYIPMLKESNVRKGFFEKSDFLSLREALPAYLKPMVTFAYKTGWRKEEVTDLKWSEVDLNNGTVRLNPGETKNEKGRTVYLDIELEDIFADLWQARKESGKLTEYVFLNGTGTDRIKDFRGAWDAASTEGGIPGKLFHDLRRTAVRNMIRANTPEVVAMKISGHKTRSVFDRYNIVSEEDLKQAALRQEEYLNSVLGKVRKFESRTKSVK
jgi:integrase